MSTATVAITLGQGYFAENAWFRLAARVDRCRRRHIRPAPLRQLHGPYEKAILVGFIPATIWVGVSLVEIFHAALLPSLILFGLYLVYVAMGSRALRRLP